MVDAAMRDVAQVMAWELEGSRLRVSLAPCRRGRRHSRIRVVDEVNPGWYRRLCAEYESERARPRRRQKPDTAIKGSHTLRALQEIASSGQARTEYAARLWPYVLEECRRYEREIARHHSWSDEAGDRLAAPATGWADPLVQSSHHQRAAEPAALLPQRAAAISDGDARYGA